MEMIDSFFRLWKPKSYEIKNEVHEERKTKIVLAEVVFGVRIT